MQPSGFNFQQNHFQLFGLPQSFALDATQLDQHYRALQTQVHPDKSAHLSEAEQRLAMQHSTQVNEAYQTLRNSLRRARYLLSLQGVDTQEETNTAMPVDFLMEQMEWREAVAEADDVSVLDELEARLHRETRVLENELAGKLDNEKNYADAAGLVRKLRFMEKLAEEIHSAYDAIDS
ncbi:MAG: Fe-S protein assembly co-chaperone HscB [Gallionellales bacterium GWA2_60_142]|nr:MAG: Fe-S protein assembly co-chaperone HscB [Gallionellales bacterium GWA2_60_142]HCI12553.1 Fe-S protein assembly co-chaperone HscB [Gallionellaceae bacterium]